MNESTPSLLANQVVLVTGGSSGCGWGFTKECLAAGASVIIADITEPSTAKLESLGKLQEHVFYIRTDVTKPESIEHTVQFAIKNFGSIDGLINNAGLTETGDFFEFMVDDMNKLFEVNLRSVMLVSQAVARVMKDKQKGAIVNISSNHALASTAHYEMYAATKGGICAMTRAMSWSLGKHGIRVNSLCPGLTRTEPIHQMTVDNPDLEKEFNAIHATQQFNSVEQLGQVGVFLLSDMAASITGSDIIADQGLLASLVTSNVLNS